MDENKGFGQRVIERTKAKKQTNAEQLYDKYCFPLTAPWEDRERIIMKKAALKILGSEFSEFIVENGLKGHARHKKIYHADVGRLIIDLVEYAHFNHLVNLTYAPPDIKRGSIIKKFDEHWCWVSEMLLQAGVRKDGVEGKGKEWRKIILNAAEEFPPYWREAIEEKVWPGRRYGPQQRKPKPHVFAAHVFTDVFLGYVPEVPTGRIVDWVNIILKSLGRPTVSKSSLNTYISSRKQEPILPGTPILITK
jgi:hypothetical protein